MLLSCRVTLQTGTTSSLSGRKLRETCLTLNFSVPKALCFTDTVTHFQSVFTKFHRTLKLADGFWLGVIQVNKLLLTCHLLPRQYLFNNGRSRGKCPPVLESVQMNAPHVPPSLIAVKSEGSSSALHT